VHAGVADGVTFADRGLVVPVGAYREQFVEGLWKVPLDFLRPFGEDPYSSLNILF
jgi:hypothetical protein